MATIWDRRAKHYNFCEGSDLRRGRHKQALFRDMVGRVLFVGVGTGIDIRHFPLGQEIIAIDISEEMLRRAEIRRREYQGVISFARMDAMELCFADAHFNTVVTSCTMCSVPDPVRAFREFHRVLSPRGQLLMFEHVRSQNPVFGLALDFMTLWSRRRGTEMNRNTLRNAQTAGFHITNVESVYLDIILAVHAAKAE